MCFASGKGKLEKTPVKSYFLLDSQGDNWVL